MVRFVVSVVLLLATIMFSIVIENGNPLSYLGPTAFMVELLVPLFAMLAVWRLVEIGRAFRDAFSEKDDAASRTRSARIWDFAEKVCYAAAVMAFLLGAVLILSRPISSEAPLGPAFAAATVGPLYGIVFAIISRILKARVEQKAARRDG